MKHVRLFLILLPSLFFLFSCSGNSKSIEGKWLLEEYCFGDDCVDMASYDIVQTWEFGNEKAMDSSYMIGRQKQENILDSKMLWRLNSSFDTLFTLDENCMNGDTLTVEFCGKDTMIVNSQINDLPVREVFIRI